MDIDYELAVLAQTQAGYLGKEQIDRLGMTDSAIRWRVRSGAWIPVRKGLYRVDGINGDHKSLLTGALAILPDPTISHESAAEIHAIPYIPKRRAVVTVHARTTHEFPGVTIHRSLDMRAHHRVKIENRWTTAPGRTLIDLAAVIRPQSFRLAADDSLARGLVSIEELGAILQEITRQGRRGCGPMRQFLEERVGDDMVSASRLERLGMKTFLQGGLPRPKWQYPAPWDREKRIDFAWPHACVGCECDGRRWHTRVADFQNDRSRDNLSLIHNWRVFRYTWDDFMRRPDLVVGQLREAIAA